MLRDFEGETELTFGVIEVVSVIPVTPIISVESGTRRPPYRVPLSVVAGRLFLGSSVLLLEATSNFETSADVITNFAPVVLALVRPLPPTEC